VELPADPVLAFFGLTVVGTSCSLCLTYLERFVLRAICQWCIASAILVSCLLVCGDALARETPPAAPEEEVHPH
jgi:uncharacterized membrane protein